MSGETERDRGPDGRFPGFDVLGQAPHWDEVTAGVVAARIGPPPALEFFTAAEAPCARALLHLLTGQDEQGGEPAVPVSEMVDARLAAGETDGWRYADMPEDAQAWRDTLSYLDADAGHRCGTSFAGAPAADQAALVQAVQAYRVHRLHTRAAGSPCQSADFRSCTAWISATWSARAAPANEVPQRRPASASRYDSVSRQA